MGRGETIKAQVATARRKRNRAVVAVASATVFGYVSLLFTFSIDYTTSLFKMAAAVSAVLAAVFFGAIWIYSGAQLALEESRKQLTGRRK